MNDVSEQDRLRALHSLLERRSVSTLEAPAPEDSEIDMIVDAGLRAPDHGKLRP
jgi:hypothetical protein